MKYHEHIRKLVLLSPLGIIERAPDEQLNERIKSEPLSIRMRIKAMKVVNKFKSLSPFSLLRLGGRVAGKPFMS